MLVNFQKYLCCLSDRYEALFSMKFIYYIKKEGNVIIRIFLLWTKPINFEKKTNQKLFN